MKSRDCKICGHHKTSHTNIGKPYGRCEVITDFATGKRCPCKKYEEKEIPNVPE